MIKKVKITEVIANPNNPRLIKDEKFRKLVKSIQDFPDMLNVRPIVVNKDMVVLGGNMRLKAIKEAGHTEVAVEIVDWNEQQQKEFIVKDNVGFGEWDWDDLANNWDAQELSEWGLDIPNFDATVLEAEEDDFAVPYGGIETDIVLGDLFEIGEHRLLCGDSTDSDAVVRLMNGYKANLLMTSPPYWVGKDYETQESEEEIEKFIIDIANTSLLAMYDDYSRIIINTGTGRATSLKGEKDTRVILLLDKWINILLDNGWKLRYIRHWIKGGGASTPRRPIDDVVYCGIEYLLTFYKAGSKSRGQNRISESWVQQSDWTDIKGDKQENKAGFPVELPARYIKLYSLENEIVYEPFTGNGTTIVASHQLNRKCYGMELDPKYCQVIVDRMQKLDPTLEIKKNGQAYIKTEQ
jgi:DNA modification methylase